jgi:hypothetical protein
MTRRLATTALVLTFAATTLTAGTGRDEKLGAGVTLSEATPIKTLYEKPQDFVGKTLRLDGVVTAVCESMGCWMALSDADDPKLTVRFKVDHGVGITFPLKAKGMKASAQGVFERITDGEGKEAAGEDKSSGDFGKSFHVKATGAVLK